MRQARRIQPVMGGGMPLPSVILAWYDLVFFYYYLVFIYLLSMMCLFLHVLGQRRTGGLSITTLRILILNQPPISFHL